MWMFKPIREVNLEKKRCNFFLNQEYIFSINAYYVSSDDDELRIDGVYVMPLSVAFATLRKGDVLEIVQGELLVYSETANKSMAFGRV